MVDQRRLVRTSLVLRSGSQTAISTLTSVIRGLIVGPMHMSLLVPFLMGTILWLVREGSN